MNSRAVLVPFGAWCRSDVAPRGDFWLLHAGIPAVACALMLALSSLTQYDTLIASRLFFNHRQWLGENTWWGEDLLHTGGRDLVRVAGAVALLTWAVGGLYPRLRAWRGGAGYVALAMIVTVGLAGLLKTLTNVDCPWDLALFDGTRPYVHVFADRPDGLARARCFPGAHSSSGFALFALYFAFRDLRPRVARTGLIVGMALGALFSFGQEARGAHFLSHDLTSAFLAWFVCLGLYVWCATRRNPRQVQ